MLDAMDGTILQTVALIVLGWLVLAVLVGAGLGAFIASAHRLEHAPFRRWAIPGRHMPRRRRTRAA